MNCTYPHCKCIVSTSTSQPVPTCPLGLEQPVVHLMDEAHGNGPWCETRELLDDSDITLHRPDVTCSNCLNGIKRTD